MKKTALKLFIAGAIVTGAGRVIAATHYVDVSSTNATPPYTNWSTAATNIQDAVDAAVAGDEIVVTNGTYATGGRAVYGTMTNRVAVNKPLALRSVNGPQFTIIQGRRLPGTGIGDGAIRCVYLTNGASLSGFTLTNGSTRAVYLSLTNRESGGGGFWCESTNNCVVSNCVLTDNRAHLGGGSYGGTLNNCTLTGNTAMYVTNSGNWNEGGGGGGSYGGALNNCTLSGNGATPSNGSSSYGGGAAGCTLNNCVLTGNGGDFGGAAAGGTLNNCVLTGNLALQGGGAWYSILNNSALTGNEAYGGWGGGIGCGGAYNCDLGFCILYNNIDDYWGALDYYDGYVSSCLIGVPPLFVDEASGNFRLQSNSPCINAGNNAYAPVGPDLDGNPRIVGGRVDIGAYEYQSLSLINFSVVSNQAGFSITGQSNQVVTVETSPDFVSWSPLATNTLNGHPFSFSDPTPATLPRRFYRAEAQ